MDDPNMHAYGDHYQDTAADIASQICRAVAELPDRNSPEDWPEAMLVTHDELQAIVVAAVEASARQLSEQPGFVMLTVDEYQAKYANIITLNDDMRYGYECLYQELTESPTAPSTEASEPVAPCNFKASGNVFHSDSQLTLIVTAEGNKCFPPRTAPPPAPVLSDAWQPIETAPERGPILIIDMNARTPQAAWGCYPCEKASGGTAVGDWYVGRNVSMRPTHWMPLPPAPAGRASRGAK